MTAVLTVAEAQSLHPNVLGFFTELTDIGLRTQTEVEHGIFMAEGETTIRRAVDAGFSMVAVMSEGKWLGRLADVIPASAIVIEDDQDRLADVTGFVIHRGAMAAFARPTPRSPESVIAAGQRFILLEGLVNHTNVGAIFRSAAAMRMDGILIGPECADPLYRRAIRTSMGTVFSLPWARVDWSDFLALTAEFEKVALTPANESIDIRVWRPAKKVVLMVGTEGDGLSARALEAATVSVRIPMAPGVDSLNAAAAAAVACYEITRGV